MITSQWTSALLASLQKEIRGDKPCVAANKSVVLYD